MPVQIIINGVDANEATRELSALAAALNGGATIQLAPATPPQKEESSGKTQRRRSGGAASAPQQEPDPKQPEPGNETPPVVDAEVQENTEDGGGGAPGDVEGGDQPTEPIPTIVELRSLITGKGLKAPDIKPILDGFGAKSLSDLPEGNRADFKKKVGALPDAGN